MTKMKKIMTKMKKMMTKMNKKRKMMTKMTKMTTQRSECFVVVYVRRRQSGDHDRLTVTNDKDDDKDDKDDNAGFRVFRRSLCPPVTKP